MKMMQLGKFILLINIFFLLAGNVSAQQGNRDSKITFEDQKQVEFIIRTYFKLLENKEYGSAWELTSNKLKAQYPKSDALEKHFGLESIKLINIKRCLMWPCTFEVPEDVPTTCFAVEIDVQPSLGSTWENGINQRFVDIVKESDGQWRINGLNTGP
jgi:hypothetical protein